MIFLTRKEVLEMPGFDGTGPRGMGPMTGGGRGFCNPYGPFYGMMPRYGAGFGPGRLGQWQGLSDDLADGDRVAPGCAVGFG